MKPTFSIIIPTYNRAHLIRKGIQSVIDQTYDNWELIIVDDGSTDDTEEVVKDYNDIRIRYVWQENQERSAARNHGIRIATGDWICFLDSDDWYDNKTLETYYKFVNTKVKIIRSLLSYVDENGRITSTTKPYNDENQLSFLIKSSGSILPYCFHRSVFDEETFYDLKTWEDKDLLLRLLGKQSFIAVNKVNVYTLDHADRSVKTPISIKEAKKTIDRMQEILQSDGIDINMKELALTNQIKSFVLIYLDKRDLKGALRLISALNYRRIYFTFYTFYKYVVR